MLKLGKLSIESTAAFKQDIIQRISDIDPSNDSTPSSLFSPLIQYIPENSLCDYIVVLLANGHTPEKITQELADFLNGDLVAAFVSWLFQRYDDFLRGRANPSPQPIVNPPVPVAANQSSFSVPDSTGNRGRVPRLPSERSGRIFQNALRGVTSMPSNKMDMDIDDAEVDTRNAPGYDVDATTNGSSKTDDSCFSRDAAMARAERFGKKGDEPSHRHQNDRKDRSRGSPPPLNKALDDGRQVRRMATNDRRGRSGNKGSGFDYRGANRSSHRSVSPILPHASSRITTIKNRARGPNIEEGLFTEDGRPITDARELLNMRRAQNQGQEGFDPEILGRKRIITLSGHNSPAASKEEGEKLVRCQFWPNCKASDCTFVHPSETCSHFPNCVFGDACIYIHPAIPCRFQDRCQNPHCNYQHSFPANMPCPARGPGASFTTVVNPYLPPSAIQCRFFPNCKNPNCPFIHPSTEACKFGVNCLKPACPFFHPTERNLASRSLVNAPCRYGKYCSKVDCPFQHNHSPIESPSAMSVESAPSAMAPTGMATSPVTLANAPAAVASEAFNNPANISQESGTLI